MPQERRREQGPLVPSILVRIDDMNIFETGPAGNGGRGMFVQGAKISAQLSLSLNIKVILATEEDNPADGDEPGQIILLGISETGQTDAMHFRADLGRVVEDIRCRIEQVLELGMTFESFVVVGDLGQRPPVHVWEAGPEILMLIGLVRLDVGATRNVSSDGLETRDDKRLVRDGSNIDGLLEGRCHCGSSQRKLDGQ